MTFHNCAIFPWSFCKPYWWIPCPLWQGIGRYKPVSLSICALWLDELGWEGVTNWLENRIWQMLCLLSCSLRLSAIFFLFLFLWLMLPEKSNHTHFPAGWVPRAEAATFPVTGSNVMAAAVAAPEHQAMKTAALQQVFKLASPSPISLPLHTYELSLSFYRNIAWEVKSKPPHQTVSCGEAELLPIPPSRDRPSHCFSLTPYFAFPMRKIWDLMFFLIEPFPSPHLWEGKTIHGCLC